MRLTILHTNDIHGREDRIAQIATLVKREKASADHQVLYLDAGDVEENSVRLSSLTKGVAMHRLLSLATCDVATVGNGSWIRYGPQAVSEQAGVSAYPQVAANFAGIDGVVPSVLLGAVGVFGLSAPMTGFGGDLDWGFERRDILESARAAARDLRARGADLVVLLSHLGLDDPPEAWDDRRIAPELQGDVDIIVGAHTHDLLADGEWIGSILVTQAGEFGEHLGRIEIDGDSIVASVEAIGEDIALDPAVLEERERVEHELADWFAEELGSIDVPFDAAFVAEVMRVRMGAEIGLCGHNVNHVLPPGVVTRGALWHASDSTGNPVAARLTGAQLTDLLERGNDPEFMAERPRVLRGSERGPVVAVGVPPEGLDPEREYLVAGTDWELEPFGGYALAEWGLVVTVDFPIIVREAVAEHLQG